MNETRYYALYRGVVKDNNDRDNLGRCRVYVPAVHGPYNFSPDLLPWATPIASSVVSTTRGTVYIPDVEDLVWVIFEGGNKLFPTYIGGLYTKENVYVDKGVVILYREGEDKITYDRKTKEITIQATKVNLNGDVYINNVSIDEIGSVSYEVIKELKF